MKTLSELTPQQRAIRRYKCWLRKHPNAPHGLKVKKFDKFLEAEGA